MKMMKYPERAKVEDFHMYDESHLITKENTIDTIDKDYVNQVVHKCTSQNTHMFIIEQQKTE